MPVPWTEVALGAHPEEPWSEWAIDEAMQAVSDAVSDGEAPTWAAAARLLLSEGLDEWQTPARAPREAALAAMAYELHGIAMSDHVAAWGSP